MLVLILLLIVAGVVAAAAALWSERKGDHTPIVEKATCATCNGENTKCEQECMMEAATKPIVYFDDEELDRYRHRPSDCYTDEEAEEFAEVMYTMRPEEVKDWNRSLILREINVPDQIKDELIMMIDHQ